MSESVTGQVVTIGRELTPDQQRRGFRVMVLSATLGFIADEPFTANILTIIALHLGAKEWYIGLLGFLLLSSWIAQVFVIQAAQRASKKKLLVVLFALMLLAGLPAPWLAKIGHRWTFSTALMVLAGCVTLRQIIAASCSPPWMGWLRQMTPSASRGRLLGVIRISWQGALMVMLILSGLYLGRTPGWEKLQVVIWISIAAQFMRTLSTFAIPSPPMHLPRHQPGWWEMMLRPLRDPDFRPFLLYTAFYGLAFGLEEGFRIVYLIRLGFGQNMALICSSLTALGAVTTLFVWGRLADRFGNHGVFSLTLLGFAGCVLCWLWVGPSRLGLGLAMVLFLAGGAFNSGNGLVHTRFLFGSLKPEWESSYIAMTYVMLQLATGLGALIGGQVLTLTQTWGLRIGGPGLNHYQVLFLASFLMCGAPWLMRSKMRTPSDASTREMIAIVLQPARSLFDSLILSSKGQDKVDD